MNIQKIFEILRGKNDNKYGEDNVKNIKEVIDFIGNNLEEDFNVQDESGTYLISYVVSLNYIEVLKKLLQTNIKIDIYDVDGRTILYIPIKFGFIDIIKVLIDYSDKSIGIPICSLMDINGNIALHYALMFKNEECIKLILNRSNCLTQDKKGNNALHHAVLSRHLEIVKLIPSHISNYNAQNISGETVLHIACRLSLVDITSFILSQQQAVHININVQEYHLQSTPLHYACFSGNEKITGMLLENNVDVNIQDIDGNTPLHYCIMYDKINLARMLITHQLSMKKINVNLFNVNLLLPLHIAFMKNPNEINMYVDILLQNTNVNFQNKFGVTCLHELCRTSLWKKFKNVLSMKKLDILLPDINEKRPIDNVNSKDLDEFIDLSIDSYYNIVINKHTTWNTQWENQCSTDINKCKQNIRKKLNRLIKNKKYDCLEKTYPQVRTSKKCIDIPVSDRVSFNTLVGLSLEVISGLLYLSKKHPNTGVILDKLDSYNDRTLDDETCEFYKKNNIPYNLLTCITRKYFIMFYKKILYVHPSVKTIFLNKLNDKSIRFIIFYIGIFGTQTGHANIVVYDKQTNEFERFDPLGSGDYGYDSSQLDEKLKNYLTSLKEKSLYISPREYLSTIGLQQIDITEVQNEYIGDPEGYCIAWSMWYTDMRVSFPDLQRKKLIKYIMQQISMKHLKYKSIVRDYSKNITNVRDDILSYANIDINQYWNNEYPEHKNEIIINKVNDEMKLLKIID